MSPNLNQSINGARILRNIRDKECQNISELYELLFPKIAGPPKHPPNVDAQRRIVNIRKIKHYLNDLALAGLIEIVEDKLSPTPLIEKVQTALDINLTEMGKIGPGSLTLTPIFGRPDENLPESDVFVLMPFSEDMLPVYEDHICKVARKLDLTVNRADDFFTVSSIMSDVWQAIYSSQILIADCTTRNPNVFYEIGLAHTVGRPTILISQTIDDVPFDLRHLRCITYEYTPRGMMEFNDTLENTLKYELEKIK